MFDKNEDFVVAKLGQVSHSVSLSVGLRLTVYSFCRCLLDPINFHLLEHQELTRGYIMIYEALEEVGGKEI